MATLPAANYLSDSARTIAEMKQALEDVLAGLKQIPGSSVAETTLTLATDEITPPSGGPGIFSVDTEGAAASDDLARIIQTNIPDGGMLILHSVSSARLVRVMHAAGGTGQLSLRTAGNFTLGDPTHWILVKRTGTLWTEIARFPKEGPMILTKSGAYTVTATDRDKLIQATSGTWTLTLPASATAGIAFLIQVQNNGTGIITLAPATGLIDGAATQAVYPNEGVWVICDGTNWTRIRGGGGTSTPDVNQLIRRDSSGRAQVVDPAVSADIATRGYVLGLTNWIGTGQLKTATGSFTQNLGASPASVTLHDYAFFPNMRAWDTTYAQPYRQLLATFPAPDGFGAPTGTVGRMGFNVVIGGGLSPTVWLDWRYITASDDPTIWGLLNQDGALVGMWVADDPPFRMEVDYVQDPITRLVERKMVKKTLPEPPMRADGLTAVKIPTAMLENISMPAHVLASADRRIEQEGLKPEHRLFRALQMYAQHDAPSSWLLDRCVWEQNELRPLTEQEYAAKHAARTIPRTEL